MSVTGELAKQAQNHPSNRGRRLELLGEPQHPLALGAELRVFLSQPVDLAGEPRGLQDDLVEQAVTGFGLVDVDLEGDSQVLERAHEATAPGQTTSKGRSDRVTHSDDRLVEPDPRAMRLLQGGTRRRDVGQGRVLLELEEGPPGDVDQRLVITALEEDLVDCFEARVENRRQPIGGSHRRHCPEHAIREEGRQGLLRGQMERSAEAIPQPRQVETTRGREHDEEGSALSFQEH